MNQLGLKQCKVCPYLDKVKSILHNENGELVNPMNKPFCTLVNDWVDETTECEGLVKIDTTEYELKCTNCGKSLAFFNVKVGEKGSEIGLMNLKYAPDLMAFRPRVDGLMGFECTCGVSDTRLSTDEFNKTPESFPEGIKTSTIEEAKFNEPTSTLEALIVQGEV